MSQKNDVAIEMPQLPGGIARNLQEKFPAIEFSFLQELVKLFQSVDVDGSGELDKDDLGKFSHWLDQLDREVSPSNDPDEKPSNSEKSYSLERFIQVLSQRRERSGLSWIRLLSIITISPFGLGFGVTMPFVFLGLEATLQRNAESWQLGLLFGGYQFSRAIANVSIGLFGSDRDLGWMFLILNLLVLLGYVLLLVFRNNGVGGLIPIYLVGLGEATVAAQQALAFETGEDRPLKMDRKLLSKRFRMQYGFWVAGAACSLIFGGIAYSEGKFTGICILGLAIQGMQFLNTAFQLFLSRFYNPKVAENGNVLESISHKVSAIRELERASTGERLDSLELRLSREAIKGDTAIAGSLKSLFKEICSQGRDSFTYVELMDAVSSLSPGLAHDPVAREASMKRLEFMLDRDDSGDISESEFVSFLLPRVNLAVNGVKVEQSPDQPLPFYVNLIVYSNFFAKLCLAVFLVLAIVKLTTVHDIKPEVAGSLMSIGSFCTVGILVYSSFSGRRKSGTKVSDKSSPFKALTSRPLQVSVNFIATGVALLLFSSKVTGLVLVAQVFLLILCNFGISIISEAAAANIPQSLFRKKQATGQLLGRLGDTVCGVSAPILFSVSPGLPFIVCGVVAIVWALLLWLAFYFRALETSPEARRGPVSAFQHFTKQKPWESREEEFRHEQILEQLNRTPALDFEQESIFLGAELHSVKSEIQELRNLKEEVQALLKK